MSGRHTKGPWFVHDEPSCPSMFYIKSAKKWSDGLWVCSTSGNLGGGFPEYMETEANARLIAAAPDLLSALVAMRNRYGYNGCEITQRANEAIAKATGEQQ